MEQLIKDCAVPFDRKYLNQLLKRLDVDHSKDVSLAEFQRLVAGQIS